MKNGFSHITVRHLILTQVNVSNDRANDFFTNLLVNSLLSSEPLTLSISLYWIILDSQQERGQSLKGFSSHLWTVEII